MNQSLLSRCRYIERFRYGKPQSREDRLREAAEEEDGGFWWMSTSPPSSSTPTQASDKHARGFLTKFKHYIHMFWLKSELVLLFLKIKALRLCF